MAPRFYSNTPISFAFRLSPEGELLAVVPLYEVKGKKKIPSRRLAPELIGGKRTVNIQPNYLWDNSGYVLGIDKKGKPERSKQTFEAFRQLHENVLSGTQDPGATALLKFLGSRQAGEVLEDQLQDCLDDLLEGGNIVFWLAGDEGFLHQRPMLRTAWERYRQQRQSATMGQCLITGEASSIASTHPPIKGVLGAQTSGAALVSFNADAYCSYGKAQNLNAPVSEAAAFAYTTALNYLLSSRRNSMILGDTTVVFWAEGKGQEEALFAELMGGPEIREAGVQAETTQLLRDTLQRVRDGRPIADLHVDSDVRMHVLGLAPNAARISVRFYQTEPFGKLLQRFTHHHEDMQVVPDGRLTSEFPPIWRLLTETAVAGKRDNVPNTLISSLMKAILSGSPYPQSLYQAILIRIRAEKEFNSVRAGIIKGCLVRWQRRDNTKEEEYTVALNEENTQQGYLLGRLFALLERAQLNAQGQNLNRTIRHSYFSAASATPATVFPQLLRLAQYHIAKDESNRWVDIEIGRVLDRLATATEQASNQGGLPSTLALKDQGLFMLGYYQQRQEFFRPHKANQVEIGEEE